MSVHVFAWFLFCLFRMIRGRRALENRQNVDDDKIEQLEELLKAATEHTNEAERKYDEVGAWPQGLAHLIIT